MKQMPVDKYNIAWFKLAEYVWRGEKERALGMYRLLCHSFQDMAFARQLEGDILWSFNDTQATDKYFQAAQLYKKDQRLLQAAAVYEHLVLLQPESVEFWHHLVDLYCNLQLKDKAAGALTNLVKQFARLDDVQQALDLVIVLESHKQMLNITPIYEHMTYKLIRKNPLQEELITAYIQQVIKFYSDADQLYEMQQFLIQLQHLNQNYFEFATRLVETA